MDTTAWTNWAIWGLVGAGIVSFIVPRVLTWIFEWSSRLIVCVTVNQSRAMDALYEEIKNLSRNNSPTDEERWNILKTIRGILNAEGYVKMELKNNSRKKLTNLTFSAPSRGWIQIGDGALIEAKADTPIKLGDLQPEGKLAIHLLTGSFFFDGSSKGFKNRISLLADEHARVSYQFPLPDHLARRRSNRVVTSLMLFGAILMIATLAGQFVKPDRAKPGDPPAAEVPAR
ncbi:hypothetical protein [Bradyrhizobium algeriense]|uniref:hypothetical protein n=1 Tax=Bradyrhizobium algeriense TaxID=634784 RepID=UPI000D3A46AC|nr:hypothetical protein [Bradyrhizobium algeriense]